MKKAGIRAGCFAALVVVSVLPVQALDTSVLTADDLQVGGYTDFGRFQLNGDGDGEIISRFGARWSLDKAINENFSAMAKLNWMFWRNQATDIQLFHIAGLKFDADLQAALTWTPGPQGSRDQTAKVGLYNFKYNPDSRNLGEYLLRSEAYPTILESSQGKDLLADSHNRILGVEYERRETSSFRHAALLYAEQFSQPVYDLNLAYLATFGNAKAEVGAGVAWARFATFTKKDSSSAVPTEGYQHIRGAGLETEAFKFMVRARAELLSLPRWKENIVLYGEAALLGTKSDTLYYKNIMERVPVMVGITLPTAGLLTELAVEVEYLKNPYHDRRYHVRDETTPLPALDDYTAELPSYAKDDWRWSVQAHRAVNQWLDLKVRFASDHLRLRSWDGDYESGSPMTRTSGDWYFLARVEFHN
jgi:hypothetical protein